MRTCGAVLAVVVAAGVGYFVGTARSGVRPPVVPAESGLDSWAQLPPWPLYRLVMNAINFLTELGARISAPQLVVIDVATAYFKSEVAYALTYHGVFDAIHEAGGSMPCAAAARTLGLTVDALCRYMRAGAAIGLLSYVRGGSEEEGTKSRAFMLSPAGELLRKDVQNSQRDFVLYINEESLQAFRGAGVHSMRSGRSGFREVFQEEHFEWHRRHPEKQAQFDKAMTSSSLHVAWAILADWAPPAENATLCDVGGGQGTVLATFLQHYPRLQGVLVDQPEVVARGEKYLAAQGVGPRARTVGASLLEPLPAALGACDVLLLKWVLHDWDDDQAVAILRNVVGVARPGSRLLIADFVIDGRPFWLTNARRMVLADIHMLGNHGSRERTAQEFRQLLARAGVAASPTFVPLRTMQSLMEAQL